MLMFILLRFSTPQVLYTCVLALVSTSPPAFREVFNLFDINGGGTIDAGELDSALKAVEIHLTHQEIQDVLHVIDEDGTYHDLWQLFKAH